MVNLKQIIQQAIDQLGAIEADEESKLHEELTNVHNLLVLALELAE